MGACAGAPPRPLHTWHILEQGTWHAVRDLADSRGGACRLTEQLGVWLCFIIPADQKGWTQSFTITMSLAAPVRPSSLKDCSNSPPTTTAQSGTGSPSASSGLDEQLIDSLLTRSRIIGIR